MTKLMQAFEANKKDRYANLLAEEQRKLEDARITDAMRQAKANLAIEGLEVVSPEADILIMSCLRGEIDHQEFVQRAAALAKKEGLGK